MTDLPIRLWDTRGLETAAFEETLAEVERALKDAAASGRPEDKIHIAWVCIAEPGGRVEDADRQLAALFRRYDMPVIVVVTKAFGSDEFAAEVHRLMPGTDAVVPVMAEAYRVPPVEPRGLPELVDETMRLLPEVARRAFVAAQLVDMAAKRSAAMRIAAAGAVSAAAAAASPIPGSGPAGVLVASAGMVAGIAAAMGVPLGRPALLALGTSVAGGLAASTAGRMLLGELLKIVPGVGSVAGGALDATIAAAVTYGLGVGFSEFLIAFHARNARMPDAAELRDGFRRFWAARAAKEIEPPADAPQDPHEGDTNTLQEPAPRA